VNGAGQIDIADEDDGNAALKLHQDETFKTLLPSCVSNVQRHIPKAVFIFAVKYARLSGGSTSAPNCERKNRLIMLVEPDTLLKRKT
jgi:hypothetical protein